MLYLCGSCDVAGDAHVNRESTLLWTRREETKKNKEWQSSKRERGGKKELQLYANEQSIKEKGNLKRGNF